MPFPSSQELDVRGSVSAGKTITDGHIIKIAEAGYDRLFLPIGALFDSAIAVVQRLKVALEVVGVALIEAGCALEAALV